MAILSGDECACCIPFTGAAEVVDEAHRVATIFIVAPRSFVRNTAGACALATALRSVAIARGRSDQRAIDAILVPRLLAAEWVGIAHSVATGGVGATWAFVWNVAARKTRSAATRNLAVAHIKCALDAILVPTNLAAVEEIFVRADLGTAFAAFTARKIVLCEAVARCQRAATATADILRRQHTTDVPARIAAVGIEAADRFAARRVVTEWRGV